MYYEQLKPNYNRFIKTKAALIGNTLVPFWKLGYDDFTAYEYPSFTFDGRSVRSLELFDTHWDLLLQKIVDCPIIEFRPAMLRGQWKWIPGETVIFNSIENKYSIGVIDRLIYPEYFSQFLFGDKLNLDDYDEPGECIYPSDEPIMVDTMYELRTYTPQYLLTNGFIVKRPTDLLKYIEYGLPR